MKKTLANVSLAVLGMLLFIGCGKGNDATTCPAGQTMQNNVCTTTGAYGNYGNYGYQTGYQGSCSSGQVQTASGCLAQGQCQPGYGWTGSTCIASVAGNQYNGQPGSQYGACGAGLVQTSLGCLPQGQCQIGMAYSQQYGQCIQATGGYNQGGYNTGYGNYYGWGANLGYGQQQQYCAYGYVYYMGQLYCR